MSICRIFFRVTVLSIAACLAGNVNSAVFERDFVPGSGDGLLTYDDVNYREWLDVTVFADEWSDGAFEIAQTDPSFDFTQEFPELAPGGVYSDFILAESSDVTALAVSAGITLGTTAADLYTLFPINDAPTRALIELLGVTLSSPNGNAIGSVGFLSEFDFDDPDPRSRHRLAADFMHERSSVVPTVGVAGLWISDDSDAFVEQYTGLMLYRDVIPEPSAVMLLMLCAAGLAKKARVHACIF